LPHAAEPIAQEIHFSRSVSPELCLHEPAFGPASQSARKEERLRIRTEFRYAATLVEFVLFCICFGFLLAGLLATLPFPAIAGNRPTVSFASAAARFLQRARRGGSASRSAIQKQWSANEFAFERAIEAYEELLDRIAERVK